MATLSELFVELPAFLQARLEEGLEQTTIPENASEAEVYRTIRFLVQDIEDENPDLTGSEALTLRAIPEAYINAVF